MIESSVVFFIADLCQSTSTVCLNLNLNVELSVFLKWKDTAK